MEKFLYEVEKITDKLRNLGYSNDEIVKILEMYFDKKICGDY